MPRYHFHLWTGDDYEFDPTGLEFANSEVAYLEAHRAAEELSCAMILAHRSPAGLRFEVADEAGVKVFDLPFAEVLGVVDENAVCGELRTANRTRLRSAVTGLNDELERSRTILRTSQQMMTDAELASNKRATAKKNKPWWGRLHGLYRYQTSRGRWWACAEDKDGKHVNFIRNRYELAGILPTFLELPVESDDTNAANKHVA